ncbi:NAD(P)H-dependent oxidoreductase [Micropruina sp.]|uniref:FMN-dependent NADH-azoreductase n=1 Tax=Micropruina sp. TaxID=2737536 RepID=UPI0026181BB2|nr:NAD(P)H-dependent oxidoreductase [Micropruina sp.]
MKLLRIDASIQGPRSASSALADLVTAEFVAGQPEATLQTRHLGADPLPSDLWATAVGASFTPEADRSPEQTAAVARAKELADELASADAVVLALPLYNWGVSQHVKTWIDVVIAGAPAGTRLLDGTPTVLITTRGGGYGPGTPKEGWDHSIDYLRRIVGEVWGADLTVIERELTLARVSPAMAGLVELADSVQQQAEQAAVAAGRALAVQLDEEANAA